MSRIIIADDHGLYRRGLRVVLESSLPGMEILEVNTLEKLVVALEEPNAVDLALVELGMPGIGDVNVVRDLRRSFSAARFIIISASDSLPIVFEALAAGLHGFISKVQTDEEILAAVADVLSGRIYVPPSIVRSTSESVGGAALAPWPGGRAPRRSDSPRLTPRQRDVLNLIAAGLSNKEIARRLEIAEPTTKIHVAALMRALDVRNRTEAAVLAKTWLERQHEALPRGGTRGEPDFLPGIDRNGFAKT